MKALKNLLKYLLPLLWIAFVSAYTVFRDFDPEMKYPTFCWDSLLQICLYAIPALLYLLCFRFSGMKCRSAKIVLRIVSGLFAALFFVVSGFALLVSERPSWVSETDKPENYGNFDSDFALNISPFEPLIPVEIPDSSENVSYFYRNAANESYLYAEWTLPLEQFEAEKLRVSDIFAGLDVKSNDSASSTRKITQTIDVSRREENNCIVYYAITYDEHEITLTFDNGVKKVSYQYIYSQLDLFM